MVLIPPQTDQLLLDTPCPALFHAVLISRSQNEGVCPRKELPQLSSHILSFPVPCLTQQSLAGSTAVAETHTLLSPGLLQNPE